MPAWSCPDCGRAFNRANTKHRCGTGDRAAMLARRPPQLVTLYEALEEAVRAFGGVEVVTHDRYALFRTTRVFADVVFMKDALRLALQLDRAFDDPRFFKTVQDARGRVQQVTLLRDEADLAAVLPCLRAAHAFAGG